MIETPHSLGRLLFLGPMMWRAASPHVVRVAPGMATTAPGLGAYDSFNERQIQNLLRFSLRVYGVDDRALAHKRAATPEPAVGLVLAGP